MSYKTLGSIVRRGSSVFTHSKTVFPKGVRMNVFRGNGRYDVDNVLLRGNRGYMKDPMGNGRGQSVVTSVSLQWACSTYFQTVIMRVSLAVGYIGSNSRQARFNAVVHCLLEEIENQLENANYNRIENEIENENSDDR